MYAVADRAVRRRFLYRTSRSPAVAARERSFLWPAMSSAGGGVANERYLTSRRRRRRPYSRSPVAGRRSAATPGRPRGALRPDSPHPRRFFNNVFFSNFFVRRVSPTVLARWPPSRRGRNVRYARDYLGQTGGERGGVARGTTAYHARDEKRAAFCVTVRKTNLVRDTENNR